MVESIVGNADPERVILFGSAARGQMDRHSDVDLLVVQAGCTNGLEQAGKLCGTLPNKRRSVDMVMSPEEFEPNRGRLCFVVEQPVVEGRTVYASPRELKTRGSFYAPTSSVNSTIAAHVLVIVYCAIVRVAIRL